jgi:hypothetical protein
MLDDLWRLELNDNPTWQPMSPSGRKPSPRCSHTAVAMGSNIVFHGGAGKEFGFPLKSFLQAMLACLFTACACFNTDACNYIHILHNLACCQTTFLSDEHLHSKDCWFCMADRVGWLIAVYREGGGGLQPLGDMFLLNTAIDEWCWPEHNSRNEPLARNAASMNLVNGHMVLHGGWAAFVETYNDTWQLQV